MWDLSYAAPSLAILAVMIGHYISLPRLPVRKNKIFIYLTIVISSTMAFDVLSSWADMDYTNFPDWLLYFLNSAYFIFFFAGALSFHFFAANILNVDLTNNLKRRYLVELPVNLAIIFVLITPWTKWLYYIDETGYHSGPLYNLLYLFYSTYILFSFAIIVKRRKYLIRVREWEILLGCNIVLSIGLVFRYSLPKFMLENLFTLAAYTVLFLGFENPDLHLIERTFLFNKVALREYVVEQNKNSPINALVFGIKNFSDKRVLYGIQQANQGIYLVQNYLRKEFPKYLIFYNDAGCFIMFSKDKTDWGEIYAKLLYRFKQPWISKDTEIYWDICGTHINFPEKKIPSDVVLRAFNKAFFNANDSLDTELLTIDKADVAFFTEETDIKRSLDYAIENNTVEVFFQPIVDSQTGKYVGAEALARIKNSEGKILSPSAFIPIAEKNGKINQLGKQMFKKCCDLVSAASFKELGLSFININLSPIQFLRNDLEQSLSSFIHESGIGSDFIHLEITEEAMIDDYQMQRQISSLTELGFKFVLDDYGVGYSNIVRLRNTPFINIKLDMSLVWDYCKNPGTILPTEIEAFKKCGFEITAEGIETAQMAKIMRDIGCNYLQGYYYSKPIPYEEFIEKCKEQK
ncbi:EAL domain-containing protein [Pseudobutyrivibrio xylanivorans]|uniref:EAL domain, c-di-GMP-specific phosphodiesterase class I (Or its enzymatically inactive variant) n=1 Tax=Pseudobutyrivibrio xylanivorans DSM 14809 TaxID=1123012 RepID=A0A1M6ABM9_PSEXY|nr:EAL domain-containing protein [Pseudobutyrivibrio xylanivorans]SHI33902.1 EAL domain, c-di-GMP-specific phosphodiesterase class I (or its enzymatically inactive variant) [Pseudobutyrivibrio xylanivorans DSM 14809]